VGRRWTRCGERKKLGDDDICILDCLNGQVSCIADRFISTPSPLQHPPTTP
jgi:hypothetical protein